MSTYDMIEEITNAYKRIDGDYVGHYLILLGEITGTTQRCYQSIYPNVGPLLFINKNKQRWSTDCTVTFTYREAEPSGSITYTRFGQEYVKQQYIEGDIYTGTIIIPSGTRSYKQHLFTGNIYQVTSLSLSDKTQDIDVYALGDNGARIMYGMNDEYIRDLADKIGHMNWISPPKCVLCDGSGVYSGIVCPDCSGTELYGYNAQDYLLTLKNRDIGVYKRDETNISFQYRGWAKKWWLTPTESEVKRYVAHFLGCSTGYVMIEYNYSPEPYWTVRIPYLIEGGITTNGILELTGTTILDLLKDVSPAGTQPVLQGYYLIIGDDSVHDYTSDISEIPHTVEITPPYSNHEPLTSDGWNSSYFGAQFGVRFFYWDKYFNPNSGIINYPDIGCFSGSVNVTDTNFFSGITTEEYNTIMYNDNFFTGSWI